MKITFLAICFVFSFSLFSQDIPEDRITDWTKAGVTEVFQFTNSVNIQDYSEFIDEDGSYTPCFEKAIIALGNEGGVVNFDNKEYFFSQPLIVPSHIVIAGHESESTVFRFNLSGKNHAIQFIGKSAAAGFKIEKEIKIGDKELQINSDFKNGEYLFIRYPDKAKLESDWAFNHFGQIVKVENNEGDRLQLENPMRLNISDVSSTDVIKIVPVSGSGIQNVSIIREDRTSGKTGSIYFKYATNCFVNGVQSEKSNYAHVLISHSSHIEVTGSYFHHAHTYGSTGEGYGVMAHFSSGDCLIEDNVFEHLRHSMIVQAGANGNVFAYNYSVDPYWKQGFFPSGTAGDLVLHGNYPYFNLFEGNIAQNLVVDGSHGINGHYNTFFRNRLEFMGITALGYPLTNSQNFVANEVTSEGLLTGMYIVVGLDHYSAYNNVRGTILPENSREPKRTLYNSSFIRDEANIGSVLGYNKTTIPAQVRFHSKEFTVSTKYYDIDTRISEIHQDLNKKGFWQRIQFWRKDR